MPQFLSLRRSGSPFGMTLLEVLIGMFILGVTTLSIVGVVVTGDRIAGRRTGLSYASTLAKNEVEKLRSAQSALVIPGDTLYSETVNGIDFEVARQNVPNDSLLKDTFNICREYTVSVKRKPGTGLLVTFHFLQGYNGAITR